FIAGALVDGVSRCFSVSAVSVSQAESPRSLPHNDTPRPDVRNIVLYATAVQSAQSGFRFWKDGNSDGQIQANELGLIVSGTGPDADFSVERNAAGDSLFLQPRRAGVLMAIYNNFAPVSDLTSIDLAPDPATGGPLGYSIDPADLIPNVGYVFQVPGPSGSVLYGALRPTHVGNQFIICSWSLQTQPNNPELRTVASPAASKP
ncbi:MAG: hypothetical protein ACM3NS_01295, partial [Deltaproteobacteria bacterium]